MNGWRWDEWIANLGDDRTDWWIIDWEEDDLKKVSLEKDIKEIRGWKI